MQLVQVEGVDALLGPHEDVLVPGVGMDPAGGAGDLQRTSVEHLGEAGPHVNLGGRRKPVRGRFGRGSCAFLRGSSIASSWRCVRR